MRVKIGDRWHDSKDEPICVELSSHEKRSIAALDEDVYHFAVYRSGSRRSEDVCRWCEARNVNVLEWNYDDGAAL